MKYTGFSASFSKAGNLPDESSVSQASINTIYTYNNIILLRSGNKNREMKTSSQPKIIQLHNFNLMSHDIYDQEERKNWSKFCSTVGKYSFKKCIPVQQS